MPEPGASSGNQGDFGGSNDMGGSGDRDDIGFDLTTPGGYKGWNQSASNPDIGFNAQNMMKHPFGPIAYGLGQFAKHIATPNFDNTYGYTDPSGYSRSDGGDRRGPMSRSFNDWMNQGGFGGPALGTPGNDFFSQDRFTGGGSPAQGVTGLLERAEGTKGGFAGRGQFPGSQPTPVQGTTAPPAPYYTPGSGTAPGVSPMPAAMYGIGPSFGPQDIFGGS